MFLTGRFCGSDSLYYTAFLVDLHSKVARNKSDAKRHVDTNDAGICAVALLNFENESAAMRLRYRIFNRYGIC